MAAPYRDWEAPMDTRRLHIVTGAPGSGKTAVLAALGEGFHVVPEPAREILAEARAGDTAARDREWGAFVSLLLRRSIEQHEAAQRLQGTIVFDRGVPDNVAYAVALSMDAAPAQDAARRYPYHPDGLVPPPLDGNQATGAEAAEPFLRTIPAP